MDISPVSLSTLRPFRHADKKTEIETAEATRIPVIRTLEKGIDDITTDFLPILQCLAFFATETTVG